MADKSLDLVVSNENRTRYDYENGNVKTSLTFTESYFGKVF